MKVPFLDLKIQYTAIQDEIAEALQRVMDNTAFAGGKFVEDFENEFASFCGSSHAIGVGNGTDALWASLLAYGIGSGDEVITVSNTFIATVEAISLTGATPVFIDVDDKTFTLDPDKLEDAITPKTKAVIPVHLYGQSADLDPIIQIARKHNLIVVEDACQAHGALYKGRSCGSIGDVGCFSFYPGKNLGAYGEAGAVITDDAAIADKIRRFRDHGQDKKYYHSEIGFNARMDGFQGAVLSVKLRYLKEWNEARRNVARKYNERLNGIDGIITPHEAEYGRHVYHLYALHMNNRDRFIQYMKDKDIFCGIHYPIPVHLQRAYAFLGYTADSFPLSEKNAREEVSLPMFPDLTDEQIDFTTDAILQYMEQYS